jgi:hypothetical protein
LPDPEMQMNQSCEIWETACKVVEEKELWMFWPCHRAGAMS